MSNLEHGKFYLARFKGFKLDKAWENPLICMAVKAHLDPRLKVFELVEVGERIQYHTTFGPRDSCNFEVIRMVSQEIGLKFRNLQMRCEVDRAQAMKAFAKKYDAKTKVSLEKAYKELLEI